jgi:DNA replication and repair protein RecF
MILSRLRLRDFRSYPELDLTFSDGLNLIEGANGTGKTNLVEAIYYLSLAKSWRTEEWKALIHEGAKEAVITASVEEGALHREIVIHLTPTGRTVEVNGKKIHRLSELSKLVNVLLFVPADTGLFVGSPGARRNFLDVSLAKTSLDYFSLIGKYNRLLYERNTLLKSPHPDKRLLDVLTERLIENEGPIVHYRRLYVDSLNEVIGGLASSLYGEKRTLHLNYRPFVKDDEHFAETARKAYDRALEGDALHKVTSVGVHREDFSLDLDAKDIALYGSQGENRLAAIALKLAPYFLVEEEGRKPLAVLDDVYSELDQVHAARLTELVKKIGQVFITAASLDILGASLIEVADHKATRRN